MIYIIIIICANICIILLFWVIWLLKNEMPESITEMKRIMCDHPEWMYISVFITHLIIGLPIFSHGIFLAVYIGLALAFLAAVYWRRRMLLVLLPIYILLPILMTGMVGFIRFANTPMSGLPETEQTVPIDSVPLNPLFVHISDLHILGPRVGPRERKSHEGDTLDPQVIKGLLDKVIRIHPRYLLITGDVTDSGSEEEWRQAEVFLKPVHDAGIKIIIAPGNHDIQTAFHGSTFGNSVLDAAALFHSYQKREISLGAELTTDVGRSLSSLMSREPDDTEVLEYAKESYTACISAPLLWQDSPLAHEQGCRSASATDFVRDVIIAQNAMAGGAATACGEWYPLIYYDAGQKAFFIVLCSSAKVASTIGNNAVAVFGNKQITRLKNVLEHAPEGTQHIFVMVHHPLVRKWGDNFGIPEHWWQWKEWTQSFLYNYVFLGAEWRDSKDIINILVAHITNHPGSTLTLLYGHRHERSLSKIRNEEHILCLSEVPAFGQGDIGFRTGYIKNIITNNGADQIEWNWVK